MGNLIFCISFIFMLNKSFSNDCAYNQVWAVQSNANLKKNNFILVTSQLDNDSILEKMHSKKGKAYLYSSQSIINLSEVDYLEGYSNTTQILFKTQSLPSLNEQYEVKFFLDNKWISDISIQNRLFPKIPFPKIQYSHFDTAKIYWLNTPKEIPENYKNKFYFSGKYYSLNISDSNQHIFLVSESTDTNKNPLRYYYEGFNNKIEVGNFFCHQGLPINYPFKFEIIQ